MDDAAVRSTRALRFPKAGFLSVPPPSFANLVDVFSSYPYLAERHLYGRRCLIVGCATVVGSIIAYQSCVIEDVKIKETPSIACLTNRMVLPGSDDALTRRIHVLEFPAEAVIRFWTYADGSDIEAMRRYYLCAESGLEKLTREEHGQLTEATE